VITSTAGSRPAAARERPRRGIARVLYGPAGRFRAFVFEPGESKRFGRDERADVALRDPELRSPHFELLFDGECFHAWELHGSGGLAIDGRPARFGETRSGGFVAAGHTTIGLFVEAEPTAPPEDERVREALEVLAPLRDTGSLFGVFDAARAPRIRVLLNESVDEHASLYEGAAAAALDDVAPYLVRFAPDSQLLERVVSEGWGDAWGVFCVSREMTKTVRRHLRRFLMVLDEAQHRWLYFRFYDPRVLRDFLPIATSRQRGEIFGPWTREDGAVGAAPCVIESLLFESDARALLRASTAPAAAAESEQPVDDARAAHQP
jgi:hypothetical protein